MNDKTARLILFIVLALATTVVLRYQIQHNALVAELAQAVAYTVQHAWTVFVKAVNFLCVAITVIAAFGLVIVLVINRLERARANA